MKNKKSPKIVYDELISPRLASDIAGVSMNTLREWDKKGLIESHRTDGGHRRYSLKSLNAHLDDIRYFSTPKESIIYASVSTEKEESELNTRLDIMKEFCSDKGWNCRVITDTECSFTCNKKGLLELIGLIESNKVERLVLSSLDNIFNFGFELIQEICKWHNVEIKIISNIQYFRRKNMKKFTGMSEKMIWDLKQELSTYFEHFEVEFDEVEQDEWVTVINDTKNSVFSKNKNGENHLVIFKTFAYNESYVSGCIELRINDEQKETSYVIIDRHTESTSISKYQNVLDLWHGVRAYNSLMHLEYECGAKNLFNDNKDILKSNITNLIFNLIGNVLFDYIEEFVDLLSVCNIERYDIEDILNYISDEDDLIYNIVDDEDIDISPSDLSLRSLNCVRP